MNEFEYRRTLVCKEFAQNVIELINYLPRFTRRRPFGQMPLAGQLDAHVTCLRRLASELGAHFATDFMTFAFNARRCSALNHPD